MFTTLRASSDDIVIQVLRGEPEAGFDCGRDAQNRFFYDWAWRDFQAQVTVTYLYYVKGVLAAFAAVSMDSVSLGRRERGLDIRFQDAPAAKLAQLAVHRSFQRTGLGRRVVADVIELAREEGTRVGCRYVTLDAQPDLVGWYESQGFDYNHLRQAERILDALMHGREPERIAVSMRFDLREAEA